MTDEQTDAGPATASPDSAEPDEDRVRVAFERALACASELEERGVKVYNSLWASPEWLALLGAAAIYSKAFLETLAKHHADAVDDHLRTRPRKNGATTEVQISIDGGTSAALVVTADMPDEARLALLDLEVTADELRGKLLRWDGSAATWRPTDDK